MAVTNSFPHGAFPEQSLDCEQPANGPLRCRLVEKQCVSFMELGVVCKNYEDIRNECSGNSTPSTLSSSVHTTAQSPITTTQLPITTRTPIKSNSTCTDNSTTFIAGIGVLVILLLAVSVGWMVSCVILLRRGQTVHKQQWVSHALNPHLMFTHTNVLFLLNVVYCYSPSVDTGTILICAWSLWIWVRIHLGKNSSG